MENPAESQVGQRPIHPSPLKGASDEISTDEIQSQYNSNKISESLESPASSVFPIVTSPSSFTSPWSTSGFMTTESDEYREHELLTGEGGTADNRTAGRDATEEAERETKETPKNGPGLNSLRCEGYPAKTVWKSGKEKAEEGMATRRSQLRAEELIISTAQMQRDSNAMLNIKLQPIIPAVETAGDKMFFEHYIFRLSRILTVETEENHPFKDTLLQLAVKHIGLMHSILALSSKHIDFRSSYGIRFLQDHPELDIQTLQERSQFHHDRAMSELRSDIERQNSGDAVEKSNVIIPAIYGQMICLVLETLADPNPTGQHRIYLEAYSNLIQKYPPEDRDFIRFIQEFFKYHIFADELMYLPEGRARLGAVSDDSNIPTAIVQPESLHLLGVLDGLCFYMSKITNIRNKIRENIFHSIDPVVDYFLMYSAAEIDADIREWIPPGCEGETHYFLGLLCKQVLWVYLWRTIYPLKTVNWNPEPRITQAVDDGLSLLIKVEPNDCNQSLLLLPTFIIGCATFKPEQREPIRIAIRKIKAYTGFRNSDPVLKVLEQVWSYMDEKDEKSWDWQRVAADMGIDVLVTSGAAFPSGSSGPRFDNKQTHYPGKPVLKEEEHIKSSERIISHSTMGSTGSISAWIGQQQILDIKRKTPKGDVLSGNLANQHLGKTSPYPSQSQDDVSEYTCDTGSEFSEDEFQGAGMICTDFLVSGITEGERKFFIDASRAFWDVWNRDFLLIISKCVGQVTPRTCGGSSSNYVAQYQPGSAATTSSNASNSMRSIGKRKRSDDEPPEDDRGQGPKRPMVGISPPNDDSSAIRFACPFRKRDPRKYNMHHDEGKWQTCAISSWPTVARVKGHLYRRHKEKPRCVRCWLYFQSDEYLKIHLKAETICPIRPEPHIESVTPDMITRLRCRRNMPEAEEERWKAMYQILFPDTKDEDVPSPLFEKVADSLAQRQTNDSTDLTIEETMRQQVPQFVIRRLEVEVRGMGLDDGTSLLDDQGHLQERLSTLITRLIHEAQDEASASYLQRTLTSIPAPSQFPTPADSSIFRSTSRPPNLTTRATHLRENESMSSPQLSQNSQYQNSRVSGTQFNNTQNYQMAQTGQAPHHRDSDHGNTPSSSSTGLQASGSNADSIPNLPEYDADEGTAFSMQGIQQLQYSLPESFPLINDETGEEIGFDTWYQLCGET
ncbi:uncharacterized protein PAC_20156 [Phialocephala subalpina]|uniref:C2H2-type domain-containing protein n=1 Tax=Phialocephala subalpina TaxID=576137 RepID=A0A1L7XZ56_9HELO|nr:uncharacterized protein PAC_20156 [Phialocephala subalpina]